MTNETTVAQDGGSSEVRPACHVHLRVRHGDPPPSPPDDLAAFCIPVTDTAVRDEWQLTDDAIAFGDRRIIARYADWRATWEQSWTLGALDMLAILRHTIIEVTNTLSVSGRRLLDTLCSIDPASPGVPVPLSDLVHLDEVMQIVRHDVHARGGGGFGAIDTTPGTNRVGLLRAWVGTESGTVLSSVDGIAVRVDHHGLGIRFADDRPEIIGIESVKLVEESTIVDAATGPAVLGPNESRAIAWLIPESAGWLVRSVPEVVVWAEAFAGVSDARRLAGALDRGAVLHLEPL